MTVVLLEASYSRQAEVVVSERCSLAGWFVLNLPTECPRGFIAVFGLISKIQRQMSGQRTKNTKVGETHRKLSVTTFSVVEEKEVAGT